MKFGYILSMEHRQACLSRWSQRAKKLARLNRRITRLSNELEALAFMQDRLEREIESSRSSREMGKDKSHEKFSNKKEVHDNDR